MTADELYQQAFRREIAALKPVSLCDVGCGAGTLLTYARSLGIAATGVEPDAAKVADASGQGLDIRAGTAEALPFPDAAFDLVTFENSLHHVTEIGRALAEAMRVARRAVVIVDPWFDLSIPSQAVGDRYERWMKTLDRMTGMVHWDPIPAGEIAAGLRLLCRPRRAAQGLGDLQGERHGPGTIRHPGGVPKHRHHRGRGVAGDHSEIVRDSGCRGAQRPQSRLRSA